MAEFLVKARNAIHVNPDKDARSSYKRGDIVVVMPDGHQWGTLETLPEFVVVKVTGLDHERAQQLIEPEVEINPETGERIPVRRRRWNIKVDDVPLAVRKALRDNGEVTVTWNQVRNFVQNKLTLAVADEVL
jgi:hypothetical protein